MSFLPALLVNLSTGTLQAFAVVGAAVIAGTASVLVARRATRGSIDTSTAADLWNAAETIRSELRTEVIARRAEIDLLTKDNQRLRERVAALESEIRTLRGLARD